METSKSISAYIVDDEYDSRSLLQQTLHEFLPGTVTILGQAGMPEKALEEVPLLKPQVLFLDIEMQQISGLDLARQLQDKGYHGKVVFVTGHEEYMLKAIRAKAFDYLLKPISTDGIMEVIKRYHQEVNQPFNEKLIHSLNITEREIEILKLLALGKNSHEIGAEIHISHHTVDTHRRKLLSKTGCRNMFEVLNLLKKG